MTWYAQSRARRFFNAFKEDAYEEFEDDITEIRRVSDGIRRRAQQGANVENRLTNLIVQENRQDIKDVKKMLQEIGRHGKLLCISNAEAHYAPMLKDRFQETKVNKESNLETRKTDELKEPDGTLSQRIQILADHFSQSRYCDKDKPNTLGPTSPPTLGRMQEPCFR